MQPLTFCIVLTDSKTGSELHLPAYKTEQTEDGWNTQCVLEGVDEEAVRAFYFDACILSVSELPPVSTVKSEGFKHTYTQVPFLSFSLL